MEIAKLVSKITSNTNLVVFKSLFSILIYIWYLIDHSNFILTNHRELLVLKRTCLTPILSKTYNQKYIVQLLYPSMKWINPLSIIQEKLPIKITQQFFCYDINACTCIFDQMHIIAYTISICICRDNICMKWTNLFQQNKLVMT